MKSSLLVLLILTTTAFGQDGIVTSSTTGTSQPQAIPRLDNQTSGSILVIVCDSNPEKWLVLDSDGKWIHAVRSIEVKLEIGKSTPKAICTMWSGPIRPTNPEIKTWDLSQLKTVSPVEFDQMVDSVQSDPEAIKKRLSK
jgi:hypothetical protein